MKQRSFEQKYQKDWATLEAMVVKKEQKTDAELPQRFRRLCHNLALAKQRGYSPKLIDYLNDSVMQSHHYFYQHNSRHSWQWLDFLTAGFPCAIRRNRNFVALAALLFLLPLLAMTLACYLNAEFVYSLLSFSDVMNIEEMYDPANRKLGRERGSETDVFMFGFYIKNNIGISFRTFAGGILFGLGSIFFLVFNGLYIGAVAGHLTQAGFSETFYSFVVGHGGFELTAIVFSGAAGLKLGYALINPGRFSRTYTLRNAGRDAVIIMFGTTLMLLIAAFIEAFWSSTALLAPAVKYAAGLVLAVLLTLYFVYCGKGHESKSA